MLVSIPFNLPSDSLNDVNRRRIRALRLSVVSGALQDPEEATQFPLAELHVTGAPWLVRSNNVLAGLGGVAPTARRRFRDSPSSIGTTDSSLEGRLSAAAGRQQPGRHEGFAIHGGSDPD